MNILTELNQVINWTHYRQMEVQQRVRQGITRFEVTAYNATTPETVVVRSTQDQDLANDVIADFYAACKAKKTAWDATALQPKAEPASEPAETPATDDVPPQTA